MKSTFLALFFLAFAFISHSATYSYTVRHTTDAPSTVLGCSQVSLKVVYNTGGSTNGIANSSQVTINQGNAHTFSVTIPTGATIVSVTVKFSFSGGNSYDYVLTNSSTSTAYIGYANCSCPPVSSKNLALTELYGRTTELQFYHTSTVGGAC